MRNHQISQMKVCIHLELYVSLYHNIIFLGFDQDDFGSCVCGGLLTSLSVIIVIVTLPFSLCVCLKVM